MFTHPFLFTAFRAALWLVIICTISHRKADVNSQKTMRKIKKSERSKKAPFRRRSSISSIFPKDYIVFWNLTLLNRHLQLNYHDDERSHKMMILSEKQRERLSALTTCAVSDAMKTLGYPNGAAKAVYPVWAGCPQLVGQVLTVRLGPVGETKPTAPLYSHAFETARPGDVLVIDNNGYMQLSCFDSRFAEKAKKCGIAGVVIDSVTRDVGGYRRLGFPVYAKGVVVPGGDDELMEYENDVMLSFAQVQVCPGDAVLADENGVVFLPVEKVDEITAAAERL